MTDESCNVVTTNILGDRDLWIRPKRKSRNRVLGWRPPEQINVKITLESYEAVRQIALAKGQKNSPFYEWFSSVVRDIEVLREELAEKQEFLILAIQDKKKYREEIDRLNLLVRTTLHD